MGVLAATWVKVSSVLRGVASGFVGGCGAVMISCMSAVFWSAADVRDAGCATG